MKNIDEALESTKTVAHLVGSLPEDTPSMLWRSGLNQALQAEAGKVRRRRQFFFAAPPMLGLTAACALAVMVFVHSPERQGVGFAPTQLVPTQAVTVAQKPPVEEVLVNLHVDDLRDNDVAGAGLNPNDPAPEQAVPPATSDDSEADLEL